MLPAILQHSPIMLDPATEEPTTDKDSTPRTGEARDHTAAVYRAVHALGLLPSTVVLQHCQIWLTKLVCWHGQMYR